MYQAGRQGMLPIGNAAGGVADGTRPGEITVHTESGDAFASPES